jgi:hypothetical protein
MSAILDRTELRQPSIWFVGRADLASALAVLCKDCLSAKTPNSLVQNEPPMIKFNAPSVTQRQLDELSSTVIRALGATAAKSQGE